MKENHLTFSPNKPQVYVVQHNGTEEGTWQYRIKCKDIPLEIILGATIGGFCAACLALLISTVVIINVNDYRQYQNYLVNKKAAEEELQKFTNPLYGGPDQMTQNPLFGKDT